MNNNSIERAVMDDESDSWYLIDDGYVWKYWIEDEPG